MHKIHAAHTERNLGHLAFRLQKALCKNVMIKLSIWSFCHGFAKYDAPMYEIWPDPFTNHYSFDTYAELAAWVSHKEILFRKF